MDYKIIEAESISYLQKMVNSIMKEGFTPCGGICVAADKIRDGNKYYQAVVNFQSHADS